MPEIRQYFFGAYCLDAARRVLLRGTEPVPLTARAFDVLLAVVERSGRIVEKDELLRIVWPDTIVEEANLSQQIFIIRRLLGAAADERPYIATVPRRGYRFVAPVRASVEAAGVAVAPIPAPATAATVRLAMLLPPSAPVALMPSTVLALSPAGNLLVYVAASEPSTKLYLRALDRVDAVPIEGTEGATNPFFSPDGQWVGFHSEAHLRKMPIAGGRPMIVCEAGGDVRGASWGADDTIVFAPGPASGLWRVSASGGTARPLTTIQFDRGERTHRWPHVLPDGRGVVFTIGTAGAASFDEASLAVAEMDGGVHQVVLQHATDGRYVPPGHLVWARGAALMVAPFDLAARRVQGPARPLASGVAVAATGVASFTCSNVGFFVHVAGEAQTLRRSLVTVGRTGAVRANYLSGEAVEEPRVAPDGASALVGMRARRSDLWLYDFLRGAFSRLTFEGENFAGIWGPGAGRITFSSSRGGPADLYCVQPDRSAPPELLIASEFDKVAGSWGAGGSILLFTEYHPETGADLWLFERAGGCARPFVRTRFNEYAPALSPDGRSIAYTSDESGRPEIQVVAYPDATGKRQLSTEGGAEPVWSRDGRELFYRSGDRVMRVDMSRGIADAGVPTTVFEGRYVAGSLTGLANYDITADGAEFLMVVQDARPLPTAVMVTLGWHAELQRPGERSEPPPTA